MHPIIYDVAVSIDGYISGPNGDISQFAQDGPVVDEYLERLSGYHTAIMGRETYEFGYRFGMKPGQNPYPHMSTHVVSQSLSLGADACVAVQSGNLGAFLTALKTNSSGPIYLVGGGVFAAAVLALGQLDRLILKRAPILLGGGTPLFAQGANLPSLTCTKSKSYADGYLLQHFNCEVS